MANDYIAHHGILGQKWGIRRFQNKDGSLTPAGKKHVSEGSDDYREAKELSKKKLKDLSNEELEKINKRRRLEDEYRHANRGESEVGKMLKQAGAKTLSNVATAAVVTAGVYFVAKHYNINASTISKKLMSKATSVVSEAMKNASKGAGEVAKSAVEGAAKVTQEARKAAQQTDFGKAVQGNKVLQSYGRAVDALLGNDKKKKQRKRGGS